VATLGQDVLADGALGKQGIASHQLPSQVNLLECRDRLREFVLSAADRHLRQHSSTLARVDAQQVSAR
jgi:hypothetical protein